MVNTSVMDLLAYMMQMDSRHVMSTCDRAVFNRCEVLEIVNCHHIVLFTETRPGKPVQTRTFLSSVLCTKLWDEQKKHTHIIILEDITRRSRMRTRRTGFGPRPRAAFALQRSDRRKLDLNMHAGSI